MNKLLLFLAILFLLICSCSSTSGKEENAPSANTLPADTLAQPIVASAPSSGIIPLQLMDGRGKIQVHKEKDETIYFEFDSEGYKQLHAYLTSADSLANIRFTQIVLPNGDTDGPFGSTMDYTLPADGIYRLLVHENMMAGDPWSGYFTAEIHLLPDE